MTTLDLVVALAMHVSRLKRLTSFSGWAGMLLTAFALVPQVSVETEAECEAIAIVCREAEHAAETCRPSADQGRFEISTSHPGHGVGPAALLGHDGRRISATLMAPLRC